MFKINSKDTKTSSMMSFWCLCYLLLIDFIHCTDFSVVNFEQVNPNWVAAGKHQWYDPFLVKHQTK